MSRLFLILCLTLSSCAAPRQKIGQALYDGGVKTGRAGTTLAVGYFPIGVPVGVPLVIVGVPIHATGALILWKKPDYHIME